MLIRFDFFAQFKIVQWFPDVTYSVDIVNDSNETLRFLHRYFSNYTCITQGPKTVAVEETITHSVKVTGGWEIGGKLDWAAGNLFAKCKVEAHAKVDHNEENSDTKEVKVTEKITYSIPPARKIEYWYDVIKHDKSFQMVAADAEFKCRDHHTNRISNWTCNKDIIEGVGVGHSDADEGVRTVGGELCDCSNDSGYLREKPDK